MQRHHKKSRKLPNLITYSLFSKYSYIIVWTRKLVHCRGLTVSECLPESTRTFRCVTVSQVIHFGFACVLKFVFSSLNKCVQILKTRLSVGQHLFIMKYSLHVWTTKIIFMCTVNHSPILSLVFTFSLYKQTPIDFEQIFLEWGLRRDCGIWPYGFYKLVWIIRIWRQYILKWFPLKYITTSCMLLGAMWMLLPYG